MKTCPFCAEQIQDAAIKCRYCGSALNGDAASAVDESAESPTTAAPDAHQQATQIACEKCRTGVMEPVTVRRWGQTLAFVGGLLVAVAVGVAGLWTIIAVANVWNESTRMKERFAFYYKDGANDLRKAGLPEWVPVEFEKHEGFVWQTYLQEAHAEGRLLDEKLEHPELSPSQLKFVSDRTNLIYRLETDEKKEYETIKTAALLSLAVPIGAAVTNLIVGLVLLLKSNVWRCTQCRYIFQRA